jgi:hypothetical protein
VIGISREPIARRTLGPALVVVPGLLAAVIAELIMSHDSVTTYQLSAPEDGGEPDDA